MSRIEEQIEIAAPQTTVFRLCHDTSLRARWDKRVASVEMLTPKPVRAGTLLRIDGRQSGGPVFSWKAEYTCFQFPGSSELRMLDTAPSNWFNSGKNPVNVKSGERGKSGGLGAGSRQIEPDRPH